MLASLIFSFHLEAVNGLCKPHYDSAGAELGVPAAKTAMAIAWGDAWTNLIQPFWALPALAIAGLGARDIMGFCVVNLLYAGFIISLCFLFI